MNIITESLFTGLWEYFLFYRGEKAGGKAEGAPEEIVKFVCSQAKNMM